MEYLETSDGEKFLKEDCTELFNKVGTSLVLWAWQTTDGALHDSDEVTDATVYVIHGKEFEEDESHLAEKYLTGVFWSMFDESQREELESDQIAMRESFANWTDSLCKDGDICQDSYNSLDMA
jgi:hypothetical protein